MNDRKFLLFSILFLTTMGELRAECSGWSVEINQHSITLCAAENRSFSMSVMNDTAMLTTCRYKWEIKKPSSSNYELIDTIDTLSYFFEEIGTYHVKASAQPNECTIYHESSPITITLYPSTVAGKISGSQVICYNTTPSAIVQTVPPIGGDANFTYQWQVKTTDSWNDLPEANSTSYQPGKLTQTTSYRLMYTNGCTSIYSNEVEVTVSPDLTAPSITETVGIICYNTSATLTRLIEAKGGIDEAFTYQWQESADGNSYMNIDGAEEASYTTPPLQSVRWYRIVATSVSGCGPITSRATKVEVYSNLTIINNPTSPLCSMESGSISVMASGAGDEYIYQWQESSDGLSFTNIPSANSASYTIPGKAAGTYYYKVLVAPTSGCSSQFSDIFTIPVYEDLVPGVIIGVDTVCYNNQPARLSQTSLPTGGDNNFSYQWQSKTIDTWRNIPGATDITFQPGNLTTTTYFRLVATTTCGSVTSNEIEVYVRKAPTTPSIPSSPETVCNGFAPALIPISTLATCDEHDSITYQWQEFVAGVWSDIPGATALTYQPESITETHQYRVVATSVKGCGQVISNVRTVNVHNKLQITTTGVEPLCYMNRGTIGVSATGEGDSYTYQWQGSLAGVWSDIEGANSQQYLTPQMVGGEYYYRCIVLPTLGCTPDTSNTINVLVYDSVAPGVISPVGADTVCYGFVPEAISVTVVATGGDGRYTYQWLEKPESATSFTPITDATETTYSPVALYETTEYQLKVTNACEVRYTNVVRIYVRKEIQAPILSDYLDTICYNTIPDPIVATSLAVGGIDDSFSYQWLSSEDGINFSEILGETNTIYQPDSLIKKTFYRLCATSNKACGDVLSNIITVNVFDSLHLETTNPDTLCYMTSAKLTITATGAGERYNYQWQELIASDWQNIPEANVASYETQPRVDGEYLYRCIVSPIKCESKTRISPIITVSVYEALSPGTIIGIDSTCYGYAPADMLRVEVPATGGDGNYTYQWQIKEHGNWKHIQGENKTSYQPEALKVETDFRLQVASRCETLYTNNILIRVNPLPEVQLIAGADNVCYNQHEIYSVEKLNPGFTYEWMVERGKGEITTEVLNANSVDVLWKTPSSKDSIILRVTNDITGCERDLKLGVSICNEQAPERTIIVRKPNSNILVCAESGDLVYQWGFTEKTSQTDFVIDDSNRRYVLLPHLFDDNKYDYWLSLRHSESSPCYSKTYYSPENDTLITPTAAKVFVPTFVHNQIPIEVQNPNGDRVSFRIYTLSGELVNQCELGKDYYLSTTLPISLNTGMYIMQVLMGEYVKSIKLIAE